MQVVIRTKDVGQRLQWRFFSMKKIGKKGFKLSFVQKREWDKEVELYVG